MKRIALAAVGIIALAAASAKAAPADVSFKGKTITVYIGYDPGGSYDLYGRLVARYLGKYIPGHPTIIAQNMPGAGSFVAANYLFNVAPKDGTALGVLTEALPIQEALKFPGVHYRSAQFNWIGRMTSILEVTYTGPKSKVKTFADAQKFETHLADTGAGSTSEGYPKMLNSLAGSKFRLVTGYPGSSRAMLAVEAGEVDGGETSWSTLTRLHPEWIKNHEIGILVQYGLERSPDLKNIPTDVELGTTQRARDMLKFYTSGAAIGRSLAAPPGLPANTVLELRSAFDAMLKDPAYQNDLKMEKLDSISASGIDLQKLMTATAEAPADIVQSVRKIVNSPIK